MPLPTTEPTNAQLDSAFFTALPREIRQLIYTELWRASNPLMKMHLHGTPPQPGEAGPRLMTTACHYVPTATYSTRGDPVDPIEFEPWQTWKSKNGGPPRWFWHAWGLRMKWAVHWKCQAVAMAGWQPQEGWVNYEEPRPVRHGGWLGCFLSCRRMYVYVPRFSDLSANGI